MRRKGNRSKDDGIGGESAKDRGSKWMEKSNETDTNGREVSRLLSESAAIWGLNLKAGETSCAKSCTYMNSVLF